MLTKKFVFAIFVAICLSENIKATSNSHDYSSHVYVPKKSFEPYVNVEPISVSNDEVADETLMELPMNANMEDVEYGVMSVSPMVEDMSYWNRQPVVDPIPLSKV